MDREGDFLRALASEGLEAYAEIAGELDSVSSHDWEELVEASRQTAARFAHGLRRVSQRSTSDSAWALAPLFSACLASLVLIQQSESPDDVPIDLLLGVEEATALVGVPELHEFLNSVD